MNLYIAKKICPPSFPYLLLAQDEHPTRFDGVPSGQSFPPTFHLATLVGLPHTVPQGPADADVLPFILRERQRQLCHLRARVKMSQLNEAFFMAQNAGLHICHK